MIGAATLALIVETSYESCEWNSCDSVLLCFSNCYWYGMDNQLRTELTPVRIEVADAGNEINPCWTELVGGRHWLSENDTRGFLSNTCKNVFWIRMRVSATSKSRIFLPLRPFQREEIPLNNFATPPRSSVSRLLSSLFRSRSFYSQVQYEFVVGSRLAPRVFFLDSPVFLLTEKPTFWIPARPG